MQLLNTEVQEKLRTLPEDPGVYLMRDEKGVVIYVGKARVLKNRVRQYFGAGAQKQSKTAAMVSKIADFEYIITDSEKEALILECNLIKQYQPYYNILLRDDKHYPYVRVDFKKDYPTVEIVRRVDKDGAKYFGPYLEAYSVRQVMDAVYKIFPVRSCGKDIVAGGRKERPCLNHQMGRCLAPCAGLVSREEYHKVLLEVCEFLSGKYKKVRDRLAAQMKEASDNLEYEKAAAVRDKLKILDKLAVEQKASFPDLSDKDVFAAVSGEKYSVVQAFFVRKGKMMGARRFYTEHSENQAELMAGFLKQYYMDRQDAPGKVYLNEAPEDRELLEEWLRELNGRKVELLKPQRGEMKKLTDMAARNAFEAIRRKEQAEQRAYDRSVGAAQKLGALLGIENLKRIECYDISNTQGTDTVASMVVFENGKPSKKEYRRFRIKTVTGADDFASMAETLERRLLEGMKSGDKEHGFWRLSRPHRGGRGQGPAVERGFRAGIPGS